MVTSEPRKAGRPKNPATRAELLQAARTAFAEKGYAGTTLTDIAVSAGLRKASLFHHFRSKEALYLEMLSDISEELAQLVAQARLAEGSFLERLDRLGILVVRYLGRHPSAARLAVRELVDGGPYSQGGGRERVALSMQAVAAFLELGMEEGVIARSDPRHLASSIIALHLFHFAAAEGISMLLEQDVFSAPAVDARAHAVLGQVRRLCGVRPAPTPATRRGI
jgi:TetR/AcrR family transcriptional regulator